MTPATQHLIRNLSNLLARGGGAVTGGSIVFLALSDPINWNWLRGIGLGIGAALLGVVLIRYIPYGSQIRPDNLSSPRAGAGEAETEDFTGPDWKLLAWPIGGCLGVLAIFGLFYLASR